MGNNMLGLGLIIFFLFFIVMMLRNVPEFWATQENMMILYGTVLSGFLLGITYVMFGRKT